MASPLRLAVAGCGRVLERFHLPAIQTSTAWTLVAACDPLSARRAWVRRAAPGVDVHEGMAKMLAAARADAVLITTPPETHADLALEALAKGLPVLVEKPIALHAEHARAVVQAAARAGRVAWTGFMRRFRAPYLELRRRLQAQAPGWDALDIELIVDARARALTGFSGDDARGGGVLDDVASHQLDLLEWLAGKPVAEVRGLSWDSGEGGERIQFEARWKDGRTARGLSGRGGGSAEQIVVALHGATVLAHPAGVLDLPGPAGRWTRRGAELRARAHFVSCRLLGLEDGTVRAFRGQLEAFAQALGGGGASDGADAAAGLRSLEGTLALRESFRRGGGWIPW